MKALGTTALSAVLFAVASAASAQMTASPAPEGMQRPFGSVPLMLPPAKSPPRDAKCDTACLTKVATDYMDALAKQDGANLDWAPRVRYAENGVPMMVGDGVWATGTARGASPLIVVDEARGRVALLGSVDEHGQPGFYALDLTVRRGQIADVSSWIRRQQGRPPFGDPIAFQHDPAFTTPLAKGKETPLPVMTGLAFAFIGAQTGKDMPPPFAKGCVLVENGVAMTGNQPAAKGETGDCASAFSRGLFKEYEDVMARLVALDPARGVLAIVGRRDLPGAEMEFTATDGKPYKAEAHYPRSTGFMTVFKIEAGAISRVETIATELPYMMPPPWRDFTAPRLSVER
jgi:hypothetical protein